MKEAIYCDDCPSRRLCAPETGHDCNYARYIQKIVDEAPPLTEEQVQTISAILRSVVIRTEAPPRPEVRKKRDHNKHRAVGPFQCQVPGCTGAPLKHSSSLWQHLRIVHEITMDEYKAKYGEPVPMTPEEQAAVVVEARCEVCGKLYSTALGNRWPRGALTSHLRGRHGLKPDGTPVGD